MYTTLEPHKYKRGGWELGTADSLGRETAKEEMQDLGKRSAALIDIYTTILLK